MTLLDNEPAVSADDTQPRITELIRQDDTIPEEPERSGCGNPLLISLVIFAFLFLCIASVGLAGYAGYRDGRNLMGTRQSGTMVAYLGVQVTLAQGDCAAGRYELCNTRCGYVATQQPAYPDMIACMATAQFALSSTPTSTPSPTSVPPTLTPTPSVVVSGDVCDAKDAYFVHAQEAMREPNYEDAVKYLEVIRGCDVTYKRADVENMLAQAYDALGHQYQRDMRLSEMIYVIKKALQLPGFRAGDWEFTINATQLYLDGKNFLTAGNYDKADKAFIKLMDQAPTYLDGHTLACQAFSAANDSESLKKYNC